MPTAFSRPNKIKKPEATIFMHLWSTQPAPPPPPTPAPLPPKKIYSTSSWIHIWNPLGDLRWSFFVKTVNVLSPLAVFAVLTV